MKNFLQKQSIQLKSLKKPAVPSFNCKGNRIQHEFNWNLIEDMEVLIPPIQNDSISRATKSVKNMIEDLQKRNRLIKIADKSPAGWNTVQEYLFDNLASDREDNKKLRAAEARALTKNKKLK